MMLRQPVATVGFIDDYCLLYRSVFEDVRSYECFKWLHVGMLSVLPRKTLPAIAKLNGLKDGQGLHHFLRDGVWDVAQVRAIRLHLIRQQIGNRPISLCIDETGDVKKGETTIMWPDNTLAIWGQPHLESLALMCGYVNRFVSKNLDSNRKAIVKHDRKAI